ncbi:hypothetical protein PV327_000842 [Microctonus hyperodae]|uniref:Uncharacterized protein n=1 Tax=Microctonus hyperodae TaxID=165561 RepID=A0AA39L2K5_MICHY|nr:hypothetical protein PV327_000842 [Microctonus hyperodae]
MYSLHNLWLLCILLPYFCYGSQQRNLKYAINPQCGILCEKKNSTTFYLRADGSNDTLHYLWDFIGNPSLLLAVTSPSTELKIDWESYLSHQPNSIRFTELPTYTFGLIIGKIIEFNDVNNTGSMDGVNDKNINILNPQFFQWRRKSDKYDGQFVELFMIGDNYVDPELNVTKSGTVELVFNGFSSAAHSDITPHMLHSENSTQIDFIINHLRTNSYFDHSRFGIELTIVSHGNTNNPMTIDTKKSLDDEHTPGVFELVEVRTQEKNVKYLQSGYLQWRPVSYTSSRRDVASATETMHYRLMNCSNISNNSILYAYYGDNTNNLLIEKLNVTLGASGDGFYKKTSYSTWSFIAGYGNPPNEQFSYLVIMIISIGVGLPVLILLIAAIYTCIRRIPRNRGTRFVNS